jgi:hypothetical protein
MLRIIARATAQKHRAGKFWMPEFAMRAFTAGCEVNPTFSKSEINWRILRGIGF